MVAASAALSGTFYRVALAAQILAYVLGLAGLDRRIAARSRLASAAASFVVLNAAAWVAFWVWASGRAGMSWRKVMYEPGRDMPALNDPLRPGEVSLGTVHQ